MLATHLSPISNSFWSWKSSPLQMPLLSLFSPPENPDPSPLSASKWIEWHIKTLSWWEEPMQIPSHEDYQEFAWEVHASFETPAACNWTKKVKNQYTLPPAHFSIMKHCFLLPMKEEFATQDIHLAQSQNTIAYMRALQYWAELVHPPVPSQPCSVVEII